MPAATKVGARHALDAAQHAAHPGTAEGTARAEHEHVRAPDRIRPLPIGRLHSQQATERPGRAVDTAALCLGSLFNRGR